MMSPEQLDFLAREIVHGRAFVYVGAGASASANLPDWKELLRKLADKVQFKSEADQKYFEGIRNQPSKSLEVADWLAEVFEDGRLGREVSAALDKTTTTSRIYQHLARVPFPMALTTNYDHLLSDAFREVEKDAHAIWEEAPPSSFLKNEAADRVIVFDWRETEAIVTAIMDGERQIILHLHGHKGKDTLVLTGRHYKKQMHGNKTFRDLLKWLFTTNTCLFVGASLEDPDLLFLFHEAKTEFGRFGPHYALLPISEAPPLRREILSDHLSIEVIPLVDTEHVRQAALDSQTDWRVIAISHVLQALSGAVAKQRLESASSRLPTSDDSGFYFKKSLWQLLEQLCRLTGSTRADFCFPENGPGGNGTELLTYFQHCGPTSPRVKYQPVNQDSICGITYYNATSEDGIYVENVDTMLISPESRLPLYRKPEYYEGYPGIKSELAVPVMADGIRVGVLNIESRLVSAFSQAHRDVVVRFAEKAGRLYVAVQRLSRRTKRLDPERIEHIYSDLCGLLGDLAHLRHDDKTTNTSLAFLVYKADYNDGCLRAQSPYKTILKDRENTRPFAVPQTMLDDTTVPLAQVFLTGRPKAFANAKTLFGKSSIQNNVSDQLAMYGPLVAFPVLIYGHIAGVVVVWKKDQQGNELDGRDVELFSRASHLVANLSIAGRDRSAKEKLGDMKGSSPNVQVAWDIVKLFLRSDGSAEKRQVLSVGAHLDDVGRLWQAELSTLIRSFLALLDRDERRFMADHGFDERPQSWISSKRCRCWVRVAKEDQADPPCFLLALQVSLSNEDPDRNLFLTPGCRSESPIASSPYPRVDYSKLFRETSAQQARRKARPVAPPREVKLVLNTSEFNAQLFEDNPHQSSLLSRIGVDRFSRIQRPQEVGKDILSAVLRKDPSRPWLIAPVVSSAESEGSDANANHMAHLHERRVIAYLTFDDGPIVNQERDSRCDLDDDEDKPEEAWSALETDILHKLDLLAGCIFERRGVRELIGKLKLC